MKWATPQIDARNALSLPPNRHKACSRALRPGSQKDFRKCPDFSPINVSQNCAKTRSSVQNKGDAQNWSKIRVHNKIAPRKVKIQSFSRLFEGQDTTEIACEVPLCGYSAVLYVKPPTANQKTRRALTYVAGAVYCWRNPKNFVCNWNRKQTTIKSLQ